ncbi:MAG TPA: DSD1 family PLP-dependent enzyme [Ramlibacter sp.]|jgi:D-serine deaminase-like pyridoxal phosphate-dependent protein|uniref:DSD1 family PLP-dependent enzyme n=1 Tax=Ramlibacter sp. TaxID=1917967 RepID=UPI002D258354|nr:DSD1 family PLP-dependent enzyme [Ramlibacter sp.]HZY18848.1 DSD1 family PLP-dependent enzyme [Ramlibacter sp.]
MLPRTKPPLSDSLKQLIGQSVDAIDTPTLVVDLDAMQRNLGRMAEFTRKHDIRWRPHAKMHKSAALARLQMQAGAVGVCVQKTAEAEAMAAGGVSDIFITNEVVAPHKLARVARLAGRLTAENGRLSIAVDSREGVLRLAQAMNDARQESGATAVIDVYVEIDVGQGRCGVPPGRLAVELVHEIRRHPALRFAGLQAYHGKAQHVRSARERRDIIAVAAQEAAFTRKLIEAEGIPVELVTGAGTGSMVCEAASGVYGELQAGSFLFMDADYAQNERDPAQPQFEHALFIKTQVMSAGLLHAVCDAGHKSHAIDSGLPRVHVPDGEPLLEYGNGGDEHGILRPARPGAPLPAIGDVLWLVPGHCDPTVNLHDHLVGVKGGLLRGVVDRIIRVDARGALT